jgi:hypothetical protein
MQIRTTSPPEHSMYNTNATQDLAGYCPENPNYLQIRARINRLINRYLSIEILSHRLSDLYQF